MPRNCGCSEQCSCGFADSESVRVTGIGTSEDPFVPDVVLPLTIQDTDTLKWTFTEGTESSLTGHPAAQSSVDIFTADGTWNRPPGVTMVRVTMIGGGGGGESGGTYGEVPPIGSRGGSGGNVTNLILTGTDIPASAPVTVGAGGAGGAAVLDEAGASIQPGNPGEPGGDSTFGVYRATGGAGGGVETTPVGTVVGQKGAVDSDTFEQQNYALSPAGGGRGYGGPSSEGLDKTAGGFCQPGKGSRSPDSLGGPVNENGQDQPVHLMGDGGGGGWGSDTNNDGEPGGNGGLYGAGGGGGASHFFSEKFSGAGGNGAPGIVVVIAW